MKQIIAYVRLAELERVIEALIGIDGLPGMEIKGLEQGKGDERDAGITYFGKKIRIELMLPDAIAREVVDTFQQKAWAGERDKEKIYVLNAKEAAQIRS